MRLQDALFNRRSIRAYTGQAVEDEKLAAVLEAARWAPSASNRQEWVFIVVRDLQIRRALVNACNKQGFLAQAPLVLVVCSLAPQALMPCGQPRGTVDCAIALTHMLLAAWGQGLGTCWIGDFDQAAVCQLLKVPDTASVVGLTPLGYPARLPGARPRKPIDHVVRQEVFQ